jgi:hypothetical protein
VNAARIAASRRNQERSDPEFSRRALHVPESFHDETASVAIRSA